MDSTSGRALAAVTGASSGIGLELAKQFAEHDFDLIIAAEDADIDAGRSTRSRSTPASGRAARSPPTRGSRTSCG